jgi:hypothetical protein
MSRSNKRSTNTKECTSHESNIPPPHQILQVARKWTSGCHRKGVSDRKPSDRSCVSDAGSYELKSPSDEVEWDLRACLKLVGNSLDELKNHRRGIGDEPT